MVLSISVPDNYAYVLAAGVATVYLTGWQTTLVARHRRKAGIKYPQAYAEKAEAEASKDALVFNCAQRAHMNTMETYPQVLCLLFFSGLKYPVLAASCGASWILGRVLYTLGYTTGDPAKRRRTPLSEIGFIGLLGASTWTAGQLIWANLDL